MRARIMGFLRDREGLELKAVGKSQCCAFEPYPLRFPHGAIDGIIASPEGLWRLFGVGPGGRGRPAPPRGVAGIVLARRGRSASSIRMNVLSAMLRASNKRCARLGNISS